MSFELEEFSESELDELSQSQSQNIDPEFQPGSEDEISDSNNSSSTQVWMNYLFAWVVSDYQSWKVVLLHLPKATHQN